MVSQADHVEWMVVDSESEALLLEHTLIKEFQPRYNVRLKDDKSYPWLALTVNDEWPRPAVVRGRKRSGVRYFGPYPNTGAIRETLDLLLRSFPVRTCSDTKLKRHQRLGRPCLMYHIERCSGPCVGAIDHAEYDRLVADLISFLGGDTAALERGPGRGDEGGVVGPRVRTGLGAPGQAGGGPGGRRRAPDGARATRGPRCVRAGRRRAGGCRPGLPRPLGQGGGPVGPVRRQGRGPDPGRAHGADPGRRLRRRRCRVCPARFWSRPCPPTPMR